MSLHGTTLARYAAREATTKQRGGRQPLGADPVRPEPDSAATREGHPPSTGLSAQVVSGVRWKVASQVILQAVSFGSTLVLARLLTARDFGLAGSALVFGGLALLFADVGLGASIVQRRELTEQDRSTAFWINTGLGLFLTIAGIGLSWPLADLYREPEVQPLFAVLSLTFLITALGTTQGAILIRNLSFRSLELRAIVATSASVAIGIALAALGYGPWAIIAQSLAISGISTVLLWRSSPWRPHFVFSIASLKHLLGYGSPIFGSDFVRYLERNADNFIVGRYRGPAQLGAYSVAYNVMLIPLLRLVTPVQQVFFPALSRMQQRNEQAEAWLRMTRVLAAIVVPGLLGLVVVAHDFVVVILGEKWQAAIPVLQVLAWVGILLSLSSQATTLFQVVGRTGIIFRLSIASAVISTGAFAIGVHWGIVGVAVGYAIAKTLLTPFYIVLAGRAVSVSIVDFCRALSGVVQAAAAMALIVLGVRLALTDRFPDGLSLVVLVAVGVVTYIPLCRWRAPEVAPEIRRLRRERGLQSDVG